MNPDEIRACPLPPLEIEELFYLESIVDEPIPVGDIGGKILNIYPISGGFFFGEKLRGELVNFGADWNYRHNPSLSEMDCRYLLKTDDGAFISVRTNGRCTLSAEQRAERMAGGQVDNNAFYYRQHLFFETASEKYSWLNNIIAFAVMGLKDNRTCYRAYYIK